MNTDTPPITLLPESSSTAPMVITSNARLQELKSSIVNITAFTVSGVGLTTLARSGKSTDYPRPEKSGLFFIVKKLKKVLTNAAIYAIL